MSSPIPFHAPATSHPMPHGTCLHISCSISFHPVPAHLKSSFVSSLVCPISHASPCMAHSHVPTHPNASHLPSHRTSCVIPHAFSFPHFVLLMQQCVQIRNQDYVITFYPIKSCPNACPISSIFSSLIPSHLIPSPILSDFHLFFLYHAIPKSSSIPSLIPISIEMIVYVFNPIPLMQCILVVDFCVLGHFAFLGYVPLRQGMWSFLYAAGFCCLVVLLWRDQI